MATLSESFARRLTADPDRTHTVMVTLQPGAADWSPSAAAGSDALRPVAGLQGIYQADLTGHEILQLGNDRQVLAIEPDDLTFEALGD